MEIKYWEVRVNRTNCEGRYIGTEVLGNFSTSANAKSFREEWIEKHQKWDPYGIDYGGRIDKETGEICFSIQITPKIFKLDD